jgi:hypothetical protein
LAASLFLLVTTLREGLPGIDREDHLIAVQVSHPRCLWQSHQRISMDQHRSRPRRRTHRPGRTPCAWRMPRLPPAGACRYRLTLRISALDDERQGVRHHHGLGAADRSAADPAMLNSYAMKPLALPPGRARLSAKPPPTGSATATNTVRSIKHAFGPDGGGRCPFRWDDKASESGGRVRQGKRDPSTHLRALPARTNLLPTQRHSRPAPACSLKISASRT